MKVILGLYFWDPFLPNIFSLCVWVCVSVCARLCVVFMCPRTALYAKLFTKFAFYSSFFGTDCVCACRYMESKLQIRWKVELVLLALTCCSSHQDTCPHTNNKISIFLLRLPTLFLFTVVSLSVLVPHLTFYFVKREETDIFCSISREFLVTYAPVLNMRARSSEELM